MSAQDCLRWMEIFLGWSIFLQTLEFFKLTDTFKVGQVWDWTVLAAELPPMGMRLRRFLDVLFDPEHGHERALLLLRCLASVCLMLGVLDSICAVFLFVVHVLLLFRFRGAFNGGSDFMTLVVLTGLLLGMGFELTGWAKHAQAAALGYVAIQLLSSYFVSGWVKLKRAEWRNGSAMVIFLDAGIYGPLGENSVFRNPKVAMFCTWSFIIWEGLAPLTLLGLDVAFLYTLIACVFHFLVFWFFGLNRFFWAWIAAWPSIWYWSGRVF